MKNLLLIILTVGLFNTAMATDVYGPDNNNMDVYTLNLKQSSVAIVEVGVETTFGCWKNFQYKKLESGSDIVILRTPVYHTMNVCDMPVQKTEGIEFSIFAEFDTPRIYKVYVPKGVLFNIK